MIDFPKIIQIETNILCNDSCDFCPQKMAVRDTKIMPDEIWIAGDINPESDGRDFKCKEITGGLKWKLK